MQKAHEIVYERMLMYSYYRPAILLRFQGELRYERIVDCEQMEIRQKLANLMNILFLRIKRRRHNGITANQIKHIFTIRTHLPWNKLRKAFAVRTQYFHELPRSFLRIRNDLTDRLAVGRLKLIILCAGTFPWNLRAIWQRIVFTFAMSVCVW